MEKATSVLYHDLFDYPLSDSEMFKWRSGKKLSEIPAIVNRGDFYFLEGREGLIYQRLLRRRISVKKFEIARKASRILSFVPTVKMVAVTGSLAMYNSTDKSDIDLMIVTRSGYLWTTRLMVYAIAKLSGIRLRKPLDKNEKDKLCLNIWLDERDLSWRGRNLYTAHEIAQVVPLVNKDNIYEKLLWNNKWILKFWPNAVKITNRGEGDRSKTKSNVVSYIFSLIEKFAYLIQYRFMKSKITREQITTTRALFHPQDWSSVVISKLNQ